MKDLLSLGECVSCGSRNLELILDLGHQPLANEYLERPNLHKNYPLKLNLCTNCYHTQLSVAVNPELLFKNYNYVSSTSATLSTYFENLRDQIIAEHGESKKLLEFGSNDGSFLKKFQNTSWNVVGIDPARNLASRAVESGIATLPFFYDGSAADLLSSSFDVAIGMNVFAHTHSPLNILTSLNKNVLEQGVVYIQTSQANMFANGEFDTVYHEHISFFNVNSMNKLLERSTWHLCDVKIVPVHGNSYLWKISRQKHACRGYHEREVYERNLGLYEPHWYSNFESKAKILANRVSERIESFRARDYLIASYGAAAKGNTFLNYAQIKLDFIFDDTPQKIGKYAPAGGTLVSDPKTMRELDSRILFLIPAWNFKEEIESKIRRIRGVRSDSALVYFPTELTWEIL